MKSRLIAGLVCAAWIWISCAPTEPFEAQTAGHLCQSLREGALGSHGMKSSARSSTTTSDTRVHAGSFSGLDVPLWPGGKIPYVLELTGPSADKILQGMQIWEQATHGIVSFWSCSLERDQRNKCPSIYLTIRNKTPEEMSVSTQISHSCTPGYLPGARLRLHAGSNIGVTTALHELGHCIGVHHEHIRHDRNSWLSYKHAGSGLPHGSLPLLGNYDFDSVMHYYAGVDDDGKPLYADFFGHLFQWTEQLSAGDVSRVMQYYAYEASKVSTTAPDGTPQVEYGWGFFMSLSEPPSTAGGLPNPYLHRDATSPTNSVSARGSPAIARLSANHLSLFARGDDQRVYWMSLRGEHVRRWEALGQVMDVNGAAKTLQIQSSPAAIATPGGGVRLFAINGLGQLVEKRYEDGSWGSWLLVAGGGPDGGLARSDGAYVGPAVASRGAGSFEVFVVRQDGRLAMSSFAQGSWGPWKTLGSSYVANARPAALAISSSEIRLAINAGSGVLYEPTVRFTALAPGMLFALGEPVHQLKPNAAPGLARWKSGYRTLVIDEHRHLSHRFSGSDSWRKIGGLVHQGTGPAVVAEGEAGAWILVHGPPARGCTQNCKDPSVAGQLIQPGGLWLRRFK